MSSQCREYIIRTDADLRQADSAYLLGLVSDRHISPRLREKAWDELWLRDFSALPATPRREPSSIH